MKVEAGRPMGLVVLGALAVVALGVSLGEEAPWGAGAPLEPAAQEAAAQPVAPLDERRFSGTLEASVGFPSAGPSIARRVVVGPTSENWFEFDAVSRGSHVVAEARWTSDEARDLGGVLFKKVGDGVGYAGLAVVTDLDWEYVTYVTGPSPLYLASPVEPGERYAWAVYPYLDQVITTLRFDAAVTLFEDEPPAEHRAFAPRR